MTMKKFTLGMTKMSNIRTIIAQELQFLLKPFVRLPNRQVHKTIGTVSAVLENQHNYERGVKLKFTVKHIWQ